MTRLGLEVNTTKTRIARLPEESFNFLGYTVGGFYGKDGRRYIGTCPSRKAVRGLLKRIHQRTTSQWYADHPRNTVECISTLLRGWCGYFNQGPVIRTFDVVRRYTERRIRRWLLRRAGQNGTGFAQIPDKIFMRRLAFIRFLFDVSTCRERRPEGVGESRMREIRMSGLTSGMWKRSMIRLVRHRRTKGWQQIGRI